jgi:hypothetical protein
MSKRFAMASGSFIASCMNCCAVSGCVVTLPLPYMSSANAT